MNRLNLQAVKQFWAIAKLYWLGDEKQGVLGLFAILGVLLFTNTQVKVFLNAMQGEFISALAARNNTRFWQVIVVAVLWIIISSLLNSCYGYVRETIGLYWRRWLTHWLLNQYFSDRAFYDLSNFHKDDIDNPDQRIAEDVANFSQQSMQFFVNIIESIFVVFAFSVILWSIDRNLVFALIAYSILSYTITIGFYGRKLTKLNFEQIKKEADFRYGLIRIRENAESIAFYNGISQEANKVKFIFSHVFENFKKLIFWSEVYLNIFKHQFGYLPLIIPALIMGNQVLSGQIEVGRVTEAAGAFGQVAFSVNLIMYQFEKFTKFAASINRLYVFSKYFKRGNKIANYDKIQIVKDNRLAIKSLTLQTPDSQKTLFKNLSFALQTGQGLLIMGESGCGKSSLLRSLAGLWNSGTGVIVRPELSEILFLPQRPYMILGTLREQLLYPNAKVDLSDEEFHQILKKVKLSYLAEQFGGFNVEKDWSDVLSLGEQQRLAFARILVTKPKYTILDEATSALDVKNEELLYNLLVETGTTFISVGHRPTLEKYHQTIITL